MKRTCGSAWLVMAGAFLFAVGGTPAVHAQDSDADDLTRGVARISLINGDVSVRRGDSGDWVAGVINAPLLAQDYVSTGPNSRAEVQFDSANLLRAGGNAEVRLVQLEYGRYQMEVARGTVTFVVLRPSNVNIELDTPSVSVRPSKIGVYRVMVNEAGATEVTVRSGDLEVFSPRGSQWLKAGQGMLARGTDDPEFQIVNAAPLDEWDQWNEGRNRAMSQAVSNRYVPEGVYGAEDLDTYGTWSNVGDNGYCWRPTNIGADWAPYRSGRWAWGDWYGWSWVSYDPWGWAPYHYGRWFYDSGNWWWNPGAFGVRQYWSPALVAWFGFGGYSGVGFGYGNVGWVPLGPREPFHRWWGRNYYGRGGFDRNINITNINVTNVYRNARVRNGISGIDSGDFRGGRFNNVRGFSGDQVRTAGLVRGQLPLGPENAHLRFSDRNVASVPRTNSNTRFFSRQQPNPAQRLSFNEQRSAFTGERGSPGGGVSGERRQNGAQGARNGAGGEARQPVQAGSREQSQQQGGWSRFGQPNRTPDAQGSNPGGAAGRQSPAARNDRPDGATQAQRGGWQRFGETPNAQPGSEAPNRRAAPRNGENGGASNQPARNSAPENRSGWQRFGEPGSSRQPASPENSGRPVDSSPNRNAGPRSSDQQQLRMTPPVVRERQSSNAPERQASPRSYSAPERQASPRSYSAPERQASPRSYSAPERQASPRSYSAPERQASPRSYSAPERQANPRSYSAPERQASPRSYSAPERQASPRSAPSYSAPRSSGGGGSASPRSMGGGPSRQSAPSGGGSRQSGGGNQRGGRR
jgi:hypothetical protein